MQHELQGISNGTAPVAGLTYVPGHAASSHAIPAMGLQTGSSPAPIHAPGAALPGAASSHAIPAMGLQTGGNADMCAVCWSSPPTHAATPCGHMAYCPRCAQNFGPNRAERVCCMCRQYIQSMVPIFGAPTQMPAPTTPMQGTTQNAGSPLPNFPVWLQGNARAIPIHLQ